jgi:hypothetical protein
MDFYFNTSMDSTYVGKYCTLVCFHPWSTYNENIWVVFSIRERHIVMSYVFNFLIQIIFFSCSWNNFYTFLLKWNQHLDLPWKKISFFKNKGRACSCGLHIQFFNRINICFRLLEQNLHAFSEMQSTFGPIMEKIGLFFVV